MTDDDDAPTRDGAPSASGYRSSPAIVPRDSRYRRGEEVARGGLGRITEAYDETLQRHVAIKEQHQRTEQGRRRFELETLTTARLQHPGIVSVFDAGTLQDEPFLVLQLLEGTTLAEEIIARATLDARMALVPNLLAVADALGYAHEQGVVHRDVKPTNIMLGTHGETVVLDWGVAYDGVRMPDDAAPVGTPRFMSPEQARGEHPIPAFDVFSLGVTIAAVLSGRQPFAERAGDDILARLATGTTDVPALPPEVPSDLASIVTKATASDGRYANASELASDLRRFIAGQLVTARRYTTRQLVARWIRRHRVLLAAAVVVLVIAAIAVSSVTRERNAAIDERERALARAHELVWLEARSHLRTDPTSTIAWLKDYPATAPHQDELLPLVDEAAGRMVARHVWITDAAVIDAGFADDGTLIVATRDGEITLLDPVTGARRQLAKLAKPPVFLRARGGRVVVLDQDGEVWRVAPDVARVGQVDSAPQATGLFIAADGGIKVTFTTADATWLGEPAVHHPELIFADDETDARAAYGITSTGELDLADPANHRVWQFTPHTFVRGSDDGTHYLALVPQGDQVGVWLGTPATAPVEIATGHACATGEDRAQLVEVINDGRIVTTLRCGVLAAYDTSAHRTIAIPDADRVTYFAVSGDGRWLAVAHSDGFDLIEIATGARRRLDSGSTIVGVGFSRDGRTLFAAGIEKGVSVWAMPEDTAMTGRLADVVSPVILFVAGDHELGIRRHLNCALWSTTEHQLIGAASITVAESAQPDDESVLWPWDIADDGRTCLFVGRDGGSVVVGLDGTKHELRTHSNGCILSGDGQQAWCAAGDKLTTVDIATDGELSARTAGGTVTGLVRVRGAPLVAVHHATSCTLETFAGQILATLPGGDTCTTPPAVSADAVLVARSNRCEIWTASGVLELAADQDHVALSPAGDRVAVLRDEQMEIWDLRTRTRVPGPPAHDRAIGPGAWSPAGVLAWTDDETVRLWDPTMQRTRAIFAPHLSSVVWSRDGRTLYGTDGQLVYAWPIDLARGADRAEVRARLDQLTSARIVDGRAATRGH